MNRKWERRATIRNGMKNMGSRFKFKAKEKKRKKYLNYWTIILLASMFKIQLIVKFNPYGYYAPVYPGFPVQIYL